MDGQYMASMPYMAGAMTDPGFASYMARGLGPTLALASAGLDSRMDEASKKSEPNVNETPASKGKGGGGQRAQQVHTSSAVGHDDAPDRRGPAGVDEAQSKFTTVMLRNIPNKYTREMIIQQLNREFAGTYDFLYLPIDFKNKCNVGYAFINFRNGDTCSVFVSQFNGVDVRKCLPGLNSKKIVEVTPARVQGFTENVRRLKNSPVMNQLREHPEWMPLLFNDRGFEEPFPKPDQPLPPVKPRGRGRAHP